MALFNFDQSSFLKGEVSPRFYGRTDDKTYFQALKEALNFLIYPQGGGTIRPGSQLVSTTITNNNDPTDGTPIAITQPKRFIPFIFSKDQAYNVIVGTENGSFSSGTTLFKDHVSILKTDGTTQSGASVNLHSIATKYLESELPEIQYAQNGDRLILVHPNHEPLVITRTPVAGFFVYSNWRYAFPVYSGTGSTSPVIGTFTETPTYFPFRDVNTDTAFTMTLSSTGTGSKTWTCSKDFFQTTHVGAYFRMNPAGTQGVGVITAVADSKHATINILTDPNSTAASVDWEESAWSDYRGWPRSICFFEQRSYFSGNLSQPDQVWGSKISDIFTMMRPRSGATDPDAFNFAPAATEINQTQWLVSGKALTIGTYGEEWLSEGLDSTLSLSNANIGFQSETKHGSEHVQALKISNAIIFVQRNGRKLREFVFNFAEDAYKADDLIQAAEHMPKKSLDIFSATTSKITQMCYQEDENSIIWCIDSNGALFGVTYDRQSGIKAAHFHQFGGSLDGNVPKVITMCVLPSSDGTRDEIHLLLKRTVDSQTVYYIEKISREFQLSSLSNSSTDINDKPVYLDSAVLSQPGGLTTTFPGFYHLEGETVGVVADGVYRGTVVVNGGNVLLDTEATEVVAGLPYTSRVKLLAPQAGSIIGSAEGETKRIHKVTMRFARSCGANYGSDESNLERLNFPLDSDDATLPIPLYTGIFVRDFDGDYSDDQNEPSIIITQDEPLPMSLTNVSLKGLTYD